MATKAHPRLGDTLPDTYRPARPEHGISRLLRRLAGIREDVLDWVPEERPPYTRLGLIVFNAGFLAATAMLIALTSVIDVSWAWLVPVALLWGYLICSIDGYLVSSTHGVQTGKWKIYVPRLVISVLIGAIIAEPLVLWYFKPSITAVVAQTRATAESSYSGKWVTCNPPDGSHPAGCAGYILNVPNSPADISQELTTEQQLLTSVQAKINSVDATIANDQYVARAECNGDALAGGQTTGVAGDGPSCQEDQRFAATAAADGNLPGLLTQESQEQGKVSTLTTELAQSRTGYGAQIKQGIAEQVARWEAGTGKPGLLDEDKALQVLASQNSFVLLQEWLLRLLLIALDALPVLTKWFSRTSKYDRLYTRQLDSGDRRHEKNLDMHERRQVTDLDLKQQENEFTYQDGLHDIANRDHISHAQRDMELREAIDRGAAERRAAARRERPSPGGS